MTKLVFATNNRHKFEEIKNKVGGQIELLGLADLNFNEEIPETKDTIEGNAIEKASFIFNRFGINCFADDTGLETDALDGAPGVYSARYAGEKATYQDNVNKLLQALHGIENRKACFKTCIALVENGRVMLFSGELQGSIAETPKGDRGFGYDPVFLPLGYDKTFAEMPLELKNKISHRALATMKLVGYLNGAANNF